MKIVVNSIKTKKILTADEKVAALKAKLAVEEKKLQNIRRQEKDNFLTTVGQKIVDEFNITDEAQEYVKDYFEKRYIYRNENFANGRDVRNFFEKALIRQADRLSYKGNNLTDEELSELTLSDIEEIKLKD